MPVVTLKPVPSSPSRSEDQAIDPVRVPSSRSVAVPVKVIGAPCSKVEPVAGAPMVTVGVALTTIVMVVAARLPPASMTEAVMTCVPELRLATMVAPLPRWPSRSEAQSMVDETSPSSGSLAVPVKVIGTGSNRAPSAGVRMCTVGVVLTTTVSVALACLPLLSVTVARIVCVPVERVLVVSVPPVPSVPSRLEVQVMPVVRSPSSASRAVAVKVIGACGSGLVPGAGAVIVMRGVALTRIVIWAVDVRPVLSVTEAVMVCVPDESPLVVIVPPVPSAPSRLEVQVIAEARLPSSASVAVAVKVTAARGSGLVPAGGAVMVTTGGVLTVTMTCMLPGLPLESLTEAVMVWMPALSALAVIDPPMPSVPSRLELHVRWAVRSPSSKSAAVAVKLTAVPGR